MPRWFELSGTLSLTGDILFSLDDNEFAGNRMFNAAAAIECLHRRLHPELENEKAADRNRRRRIEAAIPAEDRTWFKGRFINPHRPIYVERLRSLLDIAGAPMEPFIRPGRDAWIQQIKTYRNAGAHSLSDGEDITILLRLAQTAEVLMRMVLWRKLGFSEEACARMAQRDQRWEYLKEALLVRCP
ncbi:HEPN domain-containing protein [Candidatus Protofrankia californiensis]|uniref:HEPN domain-containing protein n=1 Tax=Candidatus Protofrankia californiensis TaxID=1839754 RepID=UPI001041A156